MSQNLSVHYHAHSRTCLSLNHISLFSSHPISLRCILIYSHLCLGLSIGLFPSRFLTKTLYAFFYSIIHATYLVKGTNHVASQALCLQHSEMVTLKKYTAMANLIMQPLEPVPSFTAEPSFSPEVCIVYCAWSCPSALFLSTLYCVSCSNRMLCRWLLNIYPVADRLITSAVAPLSFLKPRYQIQAQKKVLQLQFIYLFKCNLLPSCLPFVPFNFMVKNRTLNFGDLEIRYELHVLCGGRSVWKIMLFHILSCIGVNYVCSVWVSTVCLILMLCKSVTDMLSIKK